MRILFAFVLSTFISFSTNAQNPSFKPLESFDAIFARAKKENKPVFFEVFLPNCSHCMAYDVTLKNPKIKQFLDKNVLAYQLDISKRENGMFLRKQKVYVPSTPSFIMLSPEGKPWDVQTMGDELNTVDGILTTLQKAIDPQKRDEAILKKYQQGSREFDEMLGLANFTRMTLDTVQNIEIVQQLTEALPKDKYETELGFLLIRKVMLDNNNPLFDHFINNLAIYRKSNDSIIVRQVAENTLMSTLFSSRARKFSPERIAGIKYGLQKIGLTDAQIANRCIVLEVLIDLDQDQLDVATNRIKSYYQGKEIPAKEKEFWCKWLSRKSDPKNPCPLP
jgi:thiol-disulfide isomerase/thioredoxin